MKDDPMTYSGSATGMQTNERIGGLEAIRRAARMLDNCPTDFADSMPAEDLLLWCEAAAVSVWDIYPSQLTDLQVERWRDAQEQPDFVETRYGLRPTCSWLVLAYKSHDERDGSDVDGPEWVIDDEERLGTFLAPEDTLTLRSPALEHFIWEGLQAVGYTLERLEGCRIEWEGGNEYCEIYTKSGRPLARLTKEHG